VKGSDGVKDAVSVLLISDEQQQQAIEEMLSNTATGTSFILHKTDSLPNGLTLLNTQPIDVVLLFLALPDSEGINAVVKVRIQDPGVPVVVMGESRDAAAAASTLREGAQDVLIQQDVDAGLLVRSLLYAIERQGILRELQQASLFDELTGLHNRRGFIHFARHHIKVSERSRRGMILVYADLDNLKWINDNFGHQIGDEAIIATAHIIRGLFRTSDIIARVGGDEFIALALDADLSFSESILARLKEKEKDCSHPYPLSISVGFAYYDPQFPCTMEELLARADKAMYVNKRAKKRQEEGTASCLNYMPRSFRE
jgi:diguanylate cyclase (GGDEF)-like protein